jgi:hypothetical protein
LLALLLQLCVQLLGHVQLFVQAEALSLRLG